MVIPGNQHHPLITARRTWFTLTGALVYELTFKLPSFPTFSEQRKEKRLNEKTDLVTIELERKKGCCKCNCVESLALSTIVITRKSGRKRKREEIYICSAVEMAGFSSNKHRSYIVNGVTVCKDAWCTAIGVSRSW